MAAGIAQFLEGIGGGFDGDDRERTPARVAKAWIEDLVSGYAIDPDRELTFSAAPPACGPVVVRRIDFASVCVHHLLPFFGTAAIAYLPGERLAGLSKLGRVVDAHARRLQTQENLTAQVVATIDRVLQPAGVLALFEAEHTCMTLRGVRKEESRMTPVSAAGRLASDAAARAEVLGLIQAPGAGAAS